MAVFSGGLAIAAGLGTAAAGVYGAKKQADVTESSSKRAIASSEQAAAQAEQLNRERFAEAQDILSPYISTSGRARQALERELGLQAPSMQGGVMYRPGDERYVQGRDDVRGRQQRAAGATSINPINPATGQVWAQSDPTTTPQEKVIKSQVTSLQRDYQDSGRTDADEYWASPEVQTRLQIPGEQQWYYEGIGDELVSRAQPALEGEYIPAGAYEGLKRDARSIAPGGDLYRGPTEQIDPTQYFNEMTEGFSAFIDNPIYQQMIDEGVRATESSAIAGGRATGSTLKALRDVGQGVNAQFFSNYLNQLGNITGINESRMNRDIGIEEQRFANYLNMGEQRGIREENIGEQRYVNYINTLQNIADPSTATNLASLGVNQGITQGQQNAQAIAAQNQYMLGAGAAKSQSYADIAGGIGNLATAYIGAQPYGSSGVPINQQLANTTGTITPSYRGY